eukprot:COSAG01_NODE_1432_length_10321_cov_11.797789_2_plen_156_part_00
MYGCTRSSSFGLTPGFLYGCVIGHIDSDLPVDRLNPPCASHFHTVMRISSVRFMKFSYSHAHCSSLHTLYARFQSDSVLVQYLSSKILGQFWHGMAAAAAPQPAQEQEQPPIITMMGAHGLYDGPINTVMGAAPPRPARGVPPECHRKLCQPCCR